MGKKIVYHCDVCKEETEITEKKIQCIFTTEQTEGRITDPYLSIQTVEICDDCYSHILKGNYLYGQGAMGYNQYVFRY